MCSDEYKIKAMSDKETDGLLRRRLFVILFDLSASLAAGMQSKGASGEDGATITLAEQSIELLNSILSDIYRQSHGSEGVKRGHDVAIIGYSGRGLVRLAGDDERRYISAAELGVSSPSDGWLTMKVITNIESQDEYGKLAKSHRLIKFNGSRPMFELYSLATEIINEWHGERSCERSGESGCGVSQLGTNGAGDIAMINIVSGAPSDCDIQAIVDISHKIEQMAGGVLISNILMSGMVDSRHNYSYPTDSELHHNPSELFRLLGAAASISDGRRLVCCNESTIEMVSQVMSGAQG